MDFKDKQPKCKIPKSHKLKLKTEIMKNLTILRKTGKLLKFDFLRL